MPVLHSLAPVLFLLLSFPVTVSSLPCLHGTPMLSSTECSAGTKKRLSLPRALESVGLWLLSQITPCWCLKAMERCSVKTLQAGSQDQAVGGLVLSPKALGMVSSAFRWLQASVGCGPVPPVSATSFSWLCPLPSSKWPLCICGFGAQLHTPG
jgi:hypothetical protein